MPKPYMHKIAVDVPAAPKPASAVAAANTQRSGVPASNTRPPAINNTSYQSPLWEGVKAFGRQAWEPFSGAAHYWSGGRVGSDFKDDSMWVDTARRNANEYLRPENQFELTYKNNPMLDVAGKSLYYAPYIAVSALSAGAAPAVAEGGVATGGFNALAPTVQNLAARSPALMRFVSNPAVSAIGRNTAGLLNFGMSGINPLPTIASGTGALGALGSGFATQWFGQNMANAAQDINAAYADTQSPWRAGLQGAESALANGVRFDPSGIFNRAGLGAGLFTDPARSIHDQGMNQTFAQIMNDPRISPAEREFYASHPYALQMVSQQYGPQYEADQNAQANTALAMAAYNARLGNYGAAAQQGAYGLATRGANAAAPYSSYFGVSPFQMLGMRDYSTKQQENAIASDRPFMEALNTPGVSEAVNTAVRSGADPSELMNSPQVQAVMANMSREDQIKMLYALSDLYKVQAARIAPPIPSYSMQGGQ